MKLSLTNQQIQKMSEAIAALDGGYVLQLVEGKAVNVFRGYRLGHAARWALAQAQGLLQAATSSFNRAHHNLLNNHSSGEGKLAPQDARFHKFALALNELSAQPVELELPGVKLADLKPEENDLPIAVLTALQPLIIAE